MQPPFPFPCKCANGVVLNRNSNLQNVFDVHRRCTYTDLPTCTRLYLMGCFNFNSMQAMCSTIMLLHCTCINLHVGSASSSYYRRSEYTLERHFLAYGVLAFTLLRLKGVACETTHLLQHCSIGANVHWVLIFVRMPKTGSSVVQGTWVLTCIFVGCLFSMGADHPNFSVVTHYTVLVFCHSIIALCTPNA